MDIAKVSFGAKNAQSTIKVGCLCFGSNAYVKLSF